MTMPPLYKILNEVKTLPSVMAKLEALQRARDWATEVAWVDDVPNNDDETDARIAWRHLSLRIDGAICGLLTFADYRAELEAAS